MLVHTICGICDTDGVPEEQNDRQVEPCLQTMENERTFPAPGDDEC